MFAASFFLGNLALAGGFSILCAAMGDDAFEAFGFLGELTAKAPLLSRLWPHLGLTPKDEFFGWLGLAGTVVLLWLVWGLVFYRFARNDDPGALVPRTTRWLLRGSILELLVAVPSHIIVRGRNDCCAPGGTFWGITMGLSVMLMAFGPGVFFLFVERCARLKPGKEAEAVE